MEYAELNNKITHPYCGIAHPQPRSQRLAKMTSFQQLNFTSNESRERSWLRREACLLSNKQSLVKIARTCAAGAPTTTTFRIAWNLCSFQSSSEKNAAEVTQVLISFPSCERICKVDSNNKSGPQAIHTGFENYIKRFFSVLTTNKLEFLTAFSRNERFINVICLQSAAPQFVSGHFMTRNFVSIKQFTRKYGKLTSLLENMKNKQFHSKIEQFTSS